MKAEMPAEINRSVLDLELLQVLCVICTIDDSIDQILIIIAIMIITISEQQMVVSPKYITLVNILHQFST